MRLCIEVTREKIGILCPKSKKHIKTKMFKPLRFQPASFKNPICQISKIQILARNQGHILA